MGKNKNRKNNNAKKAAETEENSQPVQAAAASVKEETQPVQMQAQTPTSNEQAQTSAQGGKSRNKKNKKNQKAAANNQTEASTEAQDLQDDLKKTPTERAADYASQQEKQYESILNCFKDDQLALDKEPDFSEKKTELETKFKKEEQKKAEKQMRKDVNEWDDLFNGGPGLRTHAKGIQTLSDKVNKVLKDSVGKVIKKHTLAVTKRDEQLTTRETFEASLQKDVKMRKTLEILCAAIFKKNHDLYLQHEEMLDSERAKRSELQEDFQTRMQEVTNEINELKETRQKEVERNQEVRQKIQDQVAEYRKHEEVYSKQMGVHQQKMGVIEGKFKGELENRIGSVIKKAEEEKAKYDKACKNVFDLSDQIKNFMDRFEGLKDDITESSNSFQNFQMDVETKKVEISTLESQITSMQQTLIKKRQLQIKIKEDRTRILKQITSMNGLKKALALQLSTVK